MGSIVIELDSSGEITSRFDRSLTGRLIRSEQFGYYLHNKRGDIVQRVNAQGQILRNYRYTAFGVELSPNENNGNPFRFASMYWDAETGTYYTPNRHFNPRTGRWTQPDPYWNIHNMMACNWSRLQAGNLFVFVANNPVRFIDPLGLWLKRHHEKLTRTALTNFANTHGMTGMLNYHANIIVAGNLSVDERPYWAVNIWDDAQSRHFNTNPDGVDTRLAWGEHYMNLAVNMWLDADDFFNRGWISFDQRYEMRVQSLFYVGRGSHSIQDISAHMEFGDTTFRNGGSLLAPHFTTTDGMRHDGSFRVRFDTFDNPRYDIIRENQVAWRAVDSGSDFGSARWAEANTATTNFLNEFYRRIGMW